MTRHNLRLPCKFAGTLTQTLYGVNRGASKRHDEN
jgi:hypothetical protein